MPPDPDISAITVHLDELLEARNMTLTELASRVGLTLANLSILKTGKARAIRFTTLAAICAELHCQPGDLFTFTPTPPASSPRGQVAALRRRPAKGTEQAGAAQHRLTNPTQASRPGSR